MNGIVYTDISSVPLDEPDEPLGDTQVEALTGVVNPVEALDKVPNIFGTTSPPFVIPFNRPLSLGDVGRDVIGAKRAIWRANGRAVSLRFTTTFGPVAVRELRKFQKTVHLPADGVLGPETLKRLAPHFDAYAFTLYVGYAPHSPARARVVSYVMWGYNNRGAIGYSQYRPMAYMNDLLHLPINEDCSTFATKSYKSAGVADPNGMAYSGYGNTGTLRQHGTTVSLADSRPGDLVHYDGPQHVGVCVTGGESARVVEHGSTMGPLLLDAGYRPITMVRSYLP